MDEYINFLEEIEKTFGPEHCAYWVGPNIVLTLCDERAYCDGVFWGDTNEINHWKADLEKHFSLFLNHFPVAFHRVYVDNNDKLSDQYVCLEVITNAGLQSLPDIYKDLIRPFDLPKEPFVSEPDVFSYLSANLNQKTTKSYSTENMNHLIYGMLLGYPEKAILANVEAWQDADSGNRKTDVTEGSLQANIAYADRYPCPIPVYDYPPSMKDDPEIKQHEKRWSETLGGFYNSTFHNYLARNESFQKKIEDLSK